MTAEGEHDQLYLVRVPCFGDPDKERRRVMLNVARALHHVVKPGCAIRSVHDLYDGTEQFEVELGEPWLTFDALADDGHHPGHDSPLIPLLAIVSHDLPETGSDERQHVLDESCWCEPIVELVEAGTGPIAIRHRRPT